jgi:hypothetical protein
MPGLSLGFSTGAQVPAASLPPSYAQESAGQTISARAYGINSGGMPGGPGHTAMYGSVGVGTAATIFLVWLWWTLPR